MLVSFLFVGRLVNFQKQPFAIRTEQSLVRSMDALEASEIDPWESYQEGSVCL